MGRKYSAVATNLDIVSHPDCLALQTATTIWPKIFEIFIQSSQGPVDARAALIFSQFTNPGTGVAFTPTARDPSDPASQATVQVANFTVRPAYSNWTGGNAVVSFRSAQLILDVDQRGSVRWKAAPGREIMLSNVAGSGLGMVGLAATGSPQYDLLISWEE